jgi:hypothetical protein
MVNFGVNVCLITIPLCVHHNARLQSTRDITCLPANLNLTEAWNLSCSHHELMMPCFNQATRAKRLHNMLFFVVSRLTSLGVT